MIDHKNQRGASRKFYQTDKKVTQTSGAMSKELNKASCFNYFIGKGAIINCIIEKKKQQKKTQQTNFLNWGMEKLGKNLHNQPWPNSQNCILLTSEEKKT